MRIALLKGVFPILLFLSTSTVFAQNTDIESLRLAINELRTDYESRITELERRLAVAEQNTNQARAAAQKMAAPSPTLSVSGNSAFNPAIGVIFQGSAWSYDNDPDEYVIPGFPLGGEAGPIGEGFSLGETEIDISANVDDKFRAWLTAPIVIEDGEAKIEIEEAWAETTALPGGLAARFGRFFSGIGYLNSKHAHSWDFADQPLPYQAFLGGQYLDDGVQLRWVAPTDLYVELGTEVLRGGPYPAAGADNSGFGSYSLFANIGGDVSINSSWLAGLSYLDASAIDRPSGGENVPLLFSGDSALMVAHFIWKWAPNGNWKQRNFVFQTEFLWRNEDGEYTLPGTLPLGYDNDQRGWYAQAIYQPLPRWRFGGRIDYLSSDDPGALFNGTLLAVSDSDPRRYTLMADWSNSEFSRVRLQYSRDEAGLASDNQWGLQYIFSIGAHGAHEF
jgi:hypothetical protein